MGGLTGLRYVVRDKGVYTSMCGGVWYVQWLAMTQLFSLHVE